MKTYNEVIDKINQIKVENELSDQTVRKAQFWIFISCEMGLSTDITSSKDHITIVSANKEAQLVAEIGIEKDTVDFILIQKGYGLDFEVLFDEDNPDDLTVFHVLFKLMKGNFQKLSE